MQHTNILVTGREQLTPIVKAETAQRAEMIIKERRTKEGETGFHWMYIEPPVSWSTFLTYGYCNAYHTRAIEIKVNTTLGYGWTASPAALNYLTDITGSLGLREFLTRGLHDLEEFGNFFAEVQSIGGRIKEIYHIPAWTMYRRGEDKYVQVVDLKETELAAFGRGDLSCLHIMQYSSLSSYFGLPTWISLLETLRIDKNSKLYLSTFFDNGCMPDIIIMLEGAEFSKQSQQSIVTALTANKGVANAHRVMVLDGAPENAKYKIEKLTPPLKDFFSPDAMDYVREEIIGAHGVPPRLLGIVSSGQLGGGGEAEGQMDIFVETVIQPRQLQLAEIINNKILKPAGLPSDFAFTLPPYYQDISAGREVSGLPAAGVNKFLKYIERTL